MTVALWIVNVVLALVFLAAGSVKVFRSRAGLRRIGMTWIDDLPAVAVRLIGLAEVVGAFGLVLPLATGIAPVLAPIAATALFALMIGAIAVHLRRREAFAPALMLAVATAASAVVGYLVTLG